MASVFTAPWLLVHATLSEDEGNYELLDQQGVRLATVHREDARPADTRSWKRKLWSGSPSSVTTTTLRVVESGGRPLLTVVSAEKDRTWRAQVRNGDGDEIGEIVKTRGVHKIHLDLMHGGATVGTVDATGWSGRDFRVEQPGAVGIGRITGNPQGLELDVADSLYDHLLELDRLPAEPLAVMLTACLTWMDVSLTPEDRSE